LGVWGCLKMANLAQYMTLVIGNMMMNQTQRSPLIFRQRMFRFQALSWIEWGTDSQHCQKTFTAQRTALVKRVGSVIFLGPSKELAL
jgi:hypothetical protein